MLAKRLAPVTLALIALLPGAGVAAPDVRLADAAARGDRAAVRALIEQRVDVNAKGVEGRPLCTRPSSPITWTSPNCCCASADAKAGDRYGVTPLYLACVNGNADMMQRLLDAGADPNAVDAGRRDGVDDGRAERHAAAMRVLLERGARVDAREPEFSRRR